jgi:hypothetical protein
LGPSDERLLPRELGLKRSSRRIRTFRYQQNLSTRKIALVVLGNSPWPLVRLHIPEIVAAMNAATPGSYTEVDIPLPPKKPFTGHMS